VFVPVGVIVVVVVGVLVRVGVTVGVGVGVINTVSPSKHPSSSSILTMKSCSEYGLGTVN
jgi:hypothetical protein